MRFFVDRCAGRRLADWLRSVGHDVAEEWASREGRVLITMDKDFGELLFLQSASHTGLIRLPDVPVPVRIELMQRLLEDHSDDIRKGAVVTIRGGRIRISRPTS